VCVCVCVCLLMEIVLNFLQCVIKLREYRATAGPQSRSMSLGFFPPPIMMLALVPCNQHVEVSSPEANPLD
jgi:hypothetical protein